MAKVEVLTRETGEGWRFEVVVEEDGSRAEYEVALSKAYRKRLAPKADPETLVRESFAFLLEREPKEMIMGQFDLPVIAQYFPEYEAEIRKRL